MYSPFTEFAALLLICALAGALFVRLRQPVLIAYIVVGIAAGPAVLGLVAAMRRTVYKEVNIPTLKRPIRYANTPSTIPLHLSVN